jgi:hypothetical protein
LLVVKSSLIDVVDPGPQLAIPLELDAAMEDETALETLALDAVTVVAAALVDAADIAVAPPALALVDAAPVEVAPPEPALTLVDAGAPPLP